MMKFLVPLALAAAALTIQAKPLGDTSPPPSYQPQNTPGVFHHMATIGGYEFRIFLDDSVQPPKAYAVQTDESIEKMDKAKNPLKEIKRSSREVRIYLREFMGLPYQVEPNDLPEDQPKNNFGQDPSKLPGMPKDERPPAPNGEKVTGGLYDCDPYYDAYYFGNYYTFDHNTIYINYNGVPDESKITHYSPPTTAPRDPYCQRRVKKWGNAGDSPGHMVAAELHGYGGRPNLAPQNLTMNKSPWRKFEIAASTCADKGALTTIKTFYTAEKDDFRPELYRYYIWAKNRDNQMIVEGYCTDMENKAVQKASVDECVTTETIRVRTFCNVQCLGPLCRNGADDR